MRWLIFTMLLSVSAVAYSGVHPELKPEQTNATTKKEQHGTDNFPVTIKILPASDAKANADKQEEHRKEKAHEDWWLTKATFWLAAVTTILAFFTGGLWFATYRLVSEAKDTARRQLRAYISLKSGEIVISQDKKEFSVALKFINCGQTPAYSLSISFESEIRELSEIGQIFPSTKPIEERESKSMEGPGIDINTAETKPFVNDQLNRVSNGTSAIFVWGEINYIDIFNKPHWLKFRSINGGKAHNRLTASNGWRLQPCKDGNDAD